MIAMNVRSELLKHKLNCSDDYRDELYEGREFDFHLDNDEEVSESDTPENASTAASHMQSQNNTLSQAADNKSIAASQGGSSKKARVVRVYNAPKPSTLPLVYNPKGWRSAKTKARRIQAGCFLLSMQDSRQVPPLISLFFLNLEWMISSKKLPFIQKSIFETAELCTVTINEIDEDTQKASVRLNEEGEALARLIVSTILAAAFSTFLIPFAPMSGLPGLKDVALPRHCKYSLTKIEDRPEIKEAFCHRFAQSDSEMPILLEQILRQFVSPYTPALDTCKVRATATTETCIFFKSWWCAAIAQHTVRIFAEKEEQTRSEIEKFLQRNSSVNWQPISQRIADWTAAQDKGIGGLEKSATGETTIYDLTDDNNDSFSVFDLLAQTIVDYLIAFNIRRNIL